MFSLALHFLQDRPQAEDVSQDVFLELYRSLGRIQSAEHLKAWLRRTTLNKCIDRSRRRAARHEVAWSEVYEPLCPALESDIFERQAVSSLVAQLPETQRAVLLLRYTEDLTPAEIAQLLHLPVGTVKSRLQRTLELLRKKLERQKVNT